MKIDTTASGELVLKEIFSGVLLETEEGNRLGICMRDDTFEINVMPKGVHTRNWWRVNMQNGKMISNMSNATNVLSETGESK